MKMKVVVGYPPNFAAIEAKFHPPKNAVFAYGDTLYNPGNGDITKDLLVHEKTHQEQQIEVGGVDIWWKYYIEDEAFRLEQEVEAYQRQYRCYKGNLGQFSVLVRQNMVDNFVKRVASQLAGPLYGNIITYGEAVKLIKE